MSLPQAQGHHLNYYCNSQELYGWLKAVFGVSSYRTRRQCLCSEQSQGCSTSGTFWPEALLSPTSGACRRSVWQSTFRTKKRGTQEKRSPRGLLPSFYFDPHLAFWGLLVKMTFIAKQLFPNNGASVDNLTPIIFLRSTFILKKHTRDDKTPKLQPFLLPSVTHASAGASRSSAWCALRAAPCLRGEGSPPPRGCLLPSVFAMCALSARPRQGVNVGNRQFQGCHLDFKIKFLCLWHIWVFGAKVGFTVTSLASCLVFIQREKGRLRVSRRGAVSSLIYSCSSSVLIRSPLCAAAPALGFLLTALFSGITWIWKEYLKY